LSVSVGFAFYLADGTDVEQLLTAADRHMYSVKRDHHRRRDSSALQISPLRAPTVN